MEQGTDLKLTKYEIGQRMHDVMQRYKFIPDKKRGGQKSSVNKGRPRAVDPSIVILMEEAFRNFCTLEQALYLADISKPAYYNWLAMNPEFTERIAHLKQNIGVQSRLSIMRGLKYDSDLALKVLERTEPEQFSLKQVVTHNVEFTGISLDKPKVIESLPIVTKALPESNKE